MSEVDRMAAAMLSDATLFSVGDKVTNRRGWMYDGDVATVTQVWSPIDGYSSMRIRYTTGTGPNSYVDFVCAAEIGKDCEHV